MWDWFLTVLCTYTLGFVEGPVNMCLDSEHARVVTRNVAGLCVHVVTGAVNLARILLRLGMAKAREGT